MPKAATPLSWIRRNFSSKFKKNCWRNYDVALPQSHHHVYDHGTLQNIIRIEHSIHSLFICVNFSYIPILSDLWLPPIKLPKTALMPYPVLSGLRLNIVIRCFYTTQVKLSKMSLLNYLVHSSCIGYTKPLFYCGISFHRLIFIDNWTLISLVFNSSVSCSIELYSMYIFLFIIKKSPLVCITIPKGLKFHLLSCIINS